MVKLDFVGKMTIKLPPTREFSLVWVELGGGEGWLAGEVRGKA